MKMAAVTFETRSRWPRMTLLMMLFIMPLLLHSSFGYDTSRIKCDGSGGCPDGLCCNMGGYCGNTTGFCGTGNCSSQCRYDTSQFKCDEFGGCADGLCCNFGGYCGNTTGFCGQGNCSSQCPPNYAQCGPQYNNAQCPGGMCCSIYGWCGLTSAWCGLGNCSYQCPTSSCSSNGGHCQPGECCNINGFCGIDSIDYCGLGNCKSQCPPLPPSPSPVPTSGGLPPAPASPTTQYPTPIPPIPSPVPAQGRPLRKPGGNKLGIIVGIPVGVVALLAVCVVIAFFVRRSGSKPRLGWSFTEEDPSVQLEGMPEAFSYKQLSVATRAFSQESKLGQGGFGSVYRGVLPSSGIPVAVKKINSDSSQGEKEFMAEISIISRLRHRNLIQLQGWCKDVAREKYLLVYELMPNGSLNKVLFEPAESQTACLSWPQRFNIMTGTAAAVDYLHQGWKQQVIHRDIKSSNIMLDEEWNAKLGDFGLARLVDHQRAGATTIVAGTYGYIAPEAASTGRFTDKTDVYAFGAVVLEIACGRRAFAPEFPADEIILVDWVWERLSENALLTTVDKRLVEYDKHWMEVVLIIGLLCSHPDPEARPSMQHVVEVLAGHVPVPSIQVSKPAPIYSSNSQKVWIQGLKSQSSSKAMSRSVSLVPTNTSDSTRGSSRKSLGTSSSGSLSSQTNRSSDSSAVKTITA